MALWKDNRTDMMEFVRQFAEKVASGEYVVSSLNLNPDPETRSAEISIRIYANSEPAEYYKAVVDTGTVKAGAVVNGATRGPPPETALQQRTRRLRESEFPPAEDETRFMSEQERRQRWAEIAAARDARMEADPTAPSKPAKQYEPSRITPGMAVRDLIFDDDPKP